MTVPAVLAFMGKITLAPPDSKQLLQPQLELYQRCSAHAKLGTYRGLFISESRLERGIKLHLTNGRVWSSWLSYPSREVSH